MGLKLIFYGTEEGAPSGPRWGLKMEIGDLS